MNISEVTTRDELAALLDIPTQKLTYVLYGKHTETFYKTFEIPKSNGEFRIIHAPTADLKDIQTSLAAVLSAYAETCHQENFVRSNIAHAFTKGKNSISIEPITS